MYERWWFVLGAIVLGLYALGNQPDESSTVARSSPSAATGSVAGGREAVRPGPNYLMKDGDFALIEADWKRGQFDNLLVVGVIRNLSERSKKYVQVEINLFDDSGAVVGSTVANVNNLRGGQKWRFEAPVLSSDVSRFEVYGITGF